MEQPAGVTTTQRVERQPIVSFALRFRNPLTAFTVDSDPPQQQSFQELRVALRQERVKRVPATRWSGR